MVVLGRTGPSTAAAAAQPPTPSKKKEAKVQTPEEAAVRIQRAWRRYVQRCMDPDLCKQGEVWLQAVALNKATAAIRDHFAEDITGVLADESTIEALRIAFDQMDVDNSGTLGIFELQRLWKIVFSHLDEIEISRITEHIWPDIDVDDDDEITFEEFASYMRSMGHCGSASEVDALLGLNAYLERPTKVRQWIWAIVDQAMGEKYENPCIRKASMSFTIMVQLTILISIVVMIVESLPELYNSDAGHIRVDALFIIEALCIAIFTVEFLLRTLSTPSCREYWTSTFTWIDLFAIAPFYLRVSGLQGGNSSSNSLVILRVLRLARMVRVLRVLKLGRNSEGIQLMALALQRSRLALTWALALVGMAVILFASLMFYVEKEDADMHPRWQEIPGGHISRKWVRRNSSRFDDAGKAIDFQSIPDAMWWALVALCTVGYGDMVPVTPLGKAIGAVAMITGLLVLAYPVTIISTAFTELQSEFEQKRLANRRREKFKRRFQDMKKSRGEKRADTDASSTAPPGSAAADPLDSPRSGSQPRVLCSGLSIPGTALFAESEGASTCRNSPGFGCPVAGTLRRTSSIASTTPIASEQHPHHMPPRGMRRSLTATTYAFMGLGVGRDPHARAGVTRRGTAAAKRVAGNTAAVLGERLCGLTHALSELAAVCAALEEAGRAGQLSLASHPGACPHLPQSRKASLIRRLPPAVLSGSQASASSAG
eukprot:TRINITY_DN1944_c0_g1_i2.p1 TRINITY_DN1944_c0_g1~~TRINITY_DN1944_c0_g1_i2.p1  ORF type:complete len:713 (+),score=230.73 TRINITY_DN1944_c0_g1_i2:93-2231(+)